MKSLIETSLFIFKSPQISVLFIDYRTCRSMDELLIVALCLLVHFWGHPSEQFTLEGNFSRWVRASRAGDQMDLIPQRTYRCKESRRVAMSQWGLSTEIMEQVCSLQPHQHQHMSPVCGDAFRRVAPDRFATLVKVSTANIMGLCNLLSSRSQTWPGKSESKLFFMGIVHEVTFTNLFHCMLHFLKWQIYIDRQVDKK